MNEKPLYIRSSRRPSRRRGMSQVVAVLFVALTIGANYFAFFRDTSSPTPPPPSPSLAPAVHQNGVRATESPALKAKRGAAGASALAKASARPTQLFAGELRRGDRVLDALDRVGLAAVEARRVVRAMERVFDFRHAQPGDEFKLEVDPAGRVDRFLYTRSPLEIYEVTRAGDAYNAVKREIVTTVEPSAFGCVIHGNFRKSLLGCTRDQDIAGRVRELLPWVVDTAAEIHDGDELRVIVEKVLADGKFLKYGRVLAVDYVGKYVSHRFFWKDGERAGYYLSDGSSLERRFLRSPIKLSGDGAYVGGQVRPTVHQYKRHLGVDYAVPKGTPIVAVADGVVGSAGPRGNSGTLVTIRHPGGDVTYYAHLSRLARGLRKRSHVKQGEVVGWSGDSGSAATPRLHFALKHKRHFVNPLQTPSTSVRKLTGEDLSAFEAIAARLTELLKSAPLFDSSVES